MIKGIKTKLIIYFSLLTLISSGILGAIILKVASNSLKAEAEKSLTTLSFEMSERTGNAIEIQKQALKVIAAIAQENSAATEEVTSSVQEQVAAMEEIAGTSENLANLANDLQAIIENFKV